MCRKIIITGTTCTGKTALGKKIGKKFSIKQIDLDDFNFLPNWIEKEKQLFVKDVNDEIEELEDWIVHTIHFNKYI